MHNTCLVLVVDMPKHAMYKTCNAHNMQCTQHGVGLRAIYIITVVLSRNHKMLGILLNITKVWKLLVCLSEVLLRPIIHSEPVYPAGVTGGIGVVVVTGSGSISSIIFTTASLVGFKQRVNNSKRGIHFCFSFLHTEMISEPKYR